VEVERPGAKAPPEVVAGVAFWFFMASPSPDGKWLAIGWITKPKMAGGQDLPPRTAECQLLLLDAEGKVFARLDGAK
jgi:hypothetical protein